jgi:hypothetical protein
MINSETIVVLLATGVIIVWIGIIVREIIRNLRNWRKYEGTVRRIHGNRTH